MTQHGSTGWTRAEFDQAVRNTLRSWRRPDILGDSPMAHSRMVAEAGGDDPVAALRRIFSSALDTLRDDPRQAKFHRVLAATFLDGAPTQEAAAERLGLPFSTYRRHLARGLSGLSALLWKAETHGISFLDSPTPSPAPG
jgi:DNA-directed RNA polymerase specialized sigma24 family protein